MKYKWVSAGFWDSAFSISISPPTIKTSDFTPVLTAFYDAAVSGSPTASIVKAQHTNRAKRRQKTKNKKQWCYFTQD